MSKKSRLKKLRYQKAQELPASNFPSSYKNKNKARFFNLAGLGIVILAALYIIFPLFKEGLPSGHDVITHAIRSKLMIEALSSGQFPVRWSQGVGIGMSTPVFNFYQVSFYYLVASFGLVMSTLTSIKLVVLLSFWMGGVFIFLFTQRFGTLSAAFAALIYLFTPYLMLDIFVRAAYPELLAVSFMAGVLWALDKLLTSGQKKYFTALAILLAFALSSHLLTALIMTPILAGYTLILLFNKEVQPKTPLLTFLASSLGIGLASFHLLPAILELNLVQSQLLGAEYYDFRAHFVELPQLFSFFWGYGISQAGTQDGMSFQFGLIQWAIIFTSLILLIINKLQKRTAVFNLHLIFWLLTLVYVIFFITEISLEFWTNIKSLSFIQYPWRFLMVVPFASATLAAILVTQLTKQWQKLTLISAATITLFLLYHSYANPATYIPNNYLKIDASDWKQSQGVKETPFADIVFLPTGILEMPPPNTPKWEILSKIKQYSLAPKIEEITWEDSKIAFNVQTTELLILRVNSHYFPGWKAFLDNQETWINNNNSFGFMEIQIPAGIHKLELKFTNTPIRAISNAISILSLLIIIIWQLSTTSYIRKLYKKIYSYLSNSSESLT